MKKLTFILSALFVLLVVSCTNELENTMQEGKLSFSSISASMGDLPTARVHLEGDGKVVWDVNDNIGIYSDIQTTPEEFTCTSVGENSAFFSSENKVSGSNFFAYYPYENTTISGSTMTYVLPKTTEYEAGTYFRQSPMIAKSTTNEFGFKHTCGFIRFSITGTQQISSLVLQGNNNEIIAGTGNIDLSDSTPILVIPSNATNASKTITMNVNSLQLSNTPTDFYFIVPETEFSNGLSLTINYLNIDSSITSIKKTTSKNVKVSRSVMKSFSAFDTDALIEEQEDMIYSALMAFYNATGGDKWTNNANWGSEKPIDEWYGVEVGLDGEKISLILNDNNLSGTINNELDELTFLHTLYIYGNKISGLNVSKNINLKRLSCGGNTIQTLDLRSNLNLLNLECYNNQMTELYVNEKIQSLTCMNNLLTNIDISKCKDLKWLNLDYNNISQIDLKTNTELLQIRLGGNPLSSLDLSANSKVEYLSLDNKILFKTLDISNMSSLKELEISPSTSNLETIYVPVNHVFSYNISLPIPDFKYKDGSILYTSSDMSADGTSEKLQTAEEGNGVDLIFMGEGFADKQLADGTYREYMNMAKDAFFGVEPYKSFKKLFNVYSVNLVSKNIGKMTNDEETALSTTIEDSGIIPGDEYKNKIFNYVSDVIGEERVNNAIICVIVNSYQPIGGAWLYDEDEIDGDYGNGAAITYITLSDRGYFFGDALLHETGHGFAKLADEYYFYTGNTIPQAQIDSYKAMETKGWWKNIDFTNNTNTIKWAKFLSDNRYANNGVGVFEGAASDYQYGVYRPTENSIMGSNGYEQGFNAPSREAIYYRIHKLAYGDSWQYNYEDFVEYDAINRTSLMISRSANIGKPMMRQHHAPIIIKGSWKDAIK